MLDPVHFIPDKNRVARMTTYPAPYDLAWRESHCGKSLSEAIEAVRGRLGVSYDLASSLVWAEVTSPAPRIPSDPELTHGDS